MGFLDDRAKSISRREGERLSAQRGCTMATKQENKCIVCNIQPMMLCHCFLQIEASKLSSHPVAEVTITAPSAPRARGDCIRDDEGHDDRDIRCVVCVMSWKRWERRRSQRRKVDFIKQTALLTV